MAPEQHRTRAAYWALAGREAVAELTGDELAQPTDPADRIGDEERSAQVRARVRARLAVYAAGHTPDHVVTSTQPREDARR